jgi:hypothetical protein
MTLCIAAICEDTEEKKGKIVLCSDMERETEGVGASETEDKLGLVRPGWPALMAGTISRAGELLNVYAEYLAKNFAGIDEFNLLDQLRKPAHIQKARLVDHYLQQTFSFNRAYFHGDGKNKLPEDFMRIQQEIISRIKLEASLIIAGYIEESIFAENTKAERPFLCVIDDDTGKDEVALEYEYAAIGSGSYPALSSLYRREQHSTNSLARTLYNVYEANCLSEKVPGVGRNIIKIDVLFPGGKVKSFTPSGYKYLRTKFLKYGPQRFREKDMEFKEEFVKPI